MKYGFIKAAIGNGRTFRLRCFDGTSERFAVTESWAHAPMRAVTHVATGMLVADRLQTRTAHYLASIFDRLLVSETVDELAAEFAALPLKIRFWAVQWRGGAAHE